MVKAWRPQWIFHAALHKSTEVLERNITESVKNNVLATLSVVRVAVEQQVEQVVLLNEKSASNLLNTMDCTKRIAEMTFQAVMEETTPLFEVMGEPPGRAQRKTAFTVLRFGRLLHAKEQRIQQIRSQVRNGGPVKINAAAPFFEMTHSEAVQMVLETVATVSAESSGDLLLLDPGRPIRLDKVAERMVELSGLRVRQGDNHGDIEIAVAGERDSSHPQKNTQEEVAEGIYRVNEPFLPWEELQSELRTLQIAAENGDVELVIAMLQKLVEGYQPAGEIKDYVYREQLQTET